MSTPPEEFAKADTHLSLSPFSLYRTYRARRRTCIRLRDFLPRYRGLIALSDPNSTCDFVGIYAGHWNLQLFRHHFARQWGQWGSELPIDTLPTGLPELGRAIERW